MIKGRVRRYRRGIRRIIRANPKHNKYDIGVDIAVITIPERLRLRELTENIQIARDKRWEFEESIKDRLIKELGISKRKLHDVEFYGENAIVKYFIDRSSKAKKSTKHKGAK